MLNECKEKFSYAIRGATFPIRMFFANIKRVIKWLPVIWNDRDWDHTFILKILQFKIYMTRKHMEKNSYHVTYERDMKNMRIAEILLERLQKEYESEAFDDHYKKWSKIRPSAYDFSSYVTPSKEELREIQTIGKKAKYMKNQDYDYLFKHLKKNIDKWWS